MQLRALKTWFLSIIVISIFSLSVLGCGQKGDLYLPDYETEKKQKTKKK